MRIVLVRHGESEFNKLCREEKEIYCGAYNTGLTDNGRRMAKNLRNNKYIQELDEIYSSDLDRAIDTAILATGKTDFKRLSILRERSLGKFEGKLEEELEKEYPQYFTDSKFMKFRRDFVTKAPEGENLEDVSKRCREFVSTLDLKSNLTIGIFTHYTFICCMLYVLMGLDKETVIKMKIPNCEPILVEGNKVGDFILKSHSLSQLTKFELY